MKLEPSSFLLRPSKEHRGSFRTAAKMLSPFLKETLWPASGFTSVQREWPTVDQLVSQYEVLLSRVRAVASGKHSDIPSELLVCRSQWLKVESYHVWILYDFRMVRYFLLNIFCKRYRFTLPHGQRSAMLISSRIALFLGAYEGRNVPRAAFDTLTVSPRSLRDAL